MKLKMKLFVTLVDDLFDKQLNNIKKNPNSDVSEALDLSLYLIF